MDAPSRRRPPRAAPRPPSPPRTSEPPAPAPSRDPMMLYCPSPKHQTPECPHPCLCVDMSCPCYVATADTYCLGCTKSTNAFDDQRLNRLHRRYAAFVALEAKEGRRYHPMERYVRMHCACPPDDEYAAMNAWLDEHPDVKAMRWPQLVRGFYDTYGAVPIPSDGCA